ncbi:hypothetical protein ACFFRR_006828 [Megaselia abdita]
MVNYKDLFQDIEYAKVKKIEVNVSDKYIVNFMQKIHVIDRYKTAMSLSFDLVKDIENLILRGELFHKFSMEYKPFLVNVTVDACAALKHKYQIYYVNQWIRFLRNQQNISKNFFDCPFKIVII